MTIKAFVPGEGCPAAILEKEPEQERKNFAQARKQVGWAVTRPALEDYPGYFREQVKKAEERFKIPDHLQTAFEACTRSLIEGNCVYDRPGAIHSEVEVTVNQNYL